MNNDDFNSLKQKVRKYCKRLLLLKNKKYI